MSTSVVPSSVFLGLASKLDPDELYKLERQYLPLGKIGGFPSWLNPVTIPQSEELECMVCHSPMAFLLQVYCTNSSEPSHAFHRYIYIFACRKGCSEPNNSSNIAVFRCQLPRDNLFYSPNGPTPLPSTSSLSFDPFFNKETFAKLCVVCGCRAGKRCSKCSKKMYCSRNHQIIDWQTSHRDECGLDDKDLTSSQQANLREKQGFTFKEYGIEMIIGEEDENENSDDDESIEDEEENKIKKNLDEKMDDGERKKLEEFEALLATKENENKLNKEENEDDNILKIEEEIEDLSFKNFNRILRQEPEQILRYNKGGHCLLATDFSKSPEIIPNCQLCGGPRQFEFQLMPYLLSLIDVDSIGGKSLDWATVLIYTCKNDCQTMEYTREFIFKQDFVSRRNEDEKS